MTNDIKNNRFQGPVYGYSTEHTDDLELVTKGWVMQMLIDEGLVTLPVYYMLQENGDFILQENGDKIIL